MSKEEILAKLKTLVPELRSKYGVQRLGLFGSAAGGKGVTNNDVDIVVEMPPDLYAMVHIKEKLEKELHSSVDLIRYRKHMNAFLKKRIDSEAIYV